MRKWLVGGLAVIVIAAVAFFTLAPGMVERSQNHVVPVAFTITPRAQALQQAAICSTRPADAARAIAHVRDLVGIDHVGLGSDFDGAVTTGFDAGQIAAITQALLDRGFSDDEIRKVMGGNVLRVLTAGMVPGK